MLVSSGLNQVEKPELAAFAEGARSRGSGSRSTGAAREGEHLLATGRSYIPEWSGREDSSRHYTGEGAVRTWPGVEERRSRVGWSAVCRGEVVSSTS
jgi:hypothetical protein